MRNFLATLDEVQQLTRKVERRLRHAEVIELLLLEEIKLDTKDDFAAPDTLKKMQAMLKDRRLDSRVEKDEEHTTYDLVYLDPTNVERRLTHDIVLSADYRRMRSLARQIAPLNKPPFFLVRENGAREQTDSWRQLFARAKEEGMKDANVQRYKGLGEMNAEQLWETTMNIEVRTLLRVDLRDLVETDEIFSTLMGEDVESRRKFIEENALDVRNLDV
jgi:DNA gyrase subunit B